MARQSRHAPPHAEKFYSLDGVRYFGYRLHGDEDTVYLYSPQDRTHHACARRAVAGEPVMEPDTFLRTAAEVAGVSERALRAWIDQQLPVLSTILGRMGQDHEESANGDLGSRPIPDR